MNDFGVGERTETVSANTRGTSPIPPTPSSKSGSLDVDVESKGELITANSTSIVLNLDAWSDGGGPISSFVVEYKKTATFSHR